MTNKKPDYLKKIEKGGPIKPTDNFEPEDVTPGLYDRKFDTDNIIAKFGFDPEDPLAELIRSIIAAHPSNKDKEDRFRKAYGALTGRSLTKKKQDDYDWLMKMAWDYHVQKYNDPNNEPVLNDLAGNAINGASLVGRGIRESVIKKLTRDFKKQKNILLARVTAQDNLDRMDNIKALKKPISNLSSIGIPVDVDVIKARHTRRDFS